MAVTRYFGDRHPPHCVMAPRMSVRSFRFDSHLFNARMRSAFAPRKPRHRVLRVVLGLVGLALLAALVVFGVVVGTAMLAAGVAYRLWRGRTKPVARDPRVVDADYRVVGKLALPSR